MSSLVVEYVEIDIAWCNLTYGVAPCMASLVSSPPTGDAKCFNTLNTCQDRENFDPGTVTLRFAKPTDGLSRDIDCVVCIKSIDFSPQIISLGENIGQRASLKVSFTDRKHSDAGDGFDKYQAERGYDPYGQGTLWGRFRQRQPFLKGASLRWYVGFAGDALADMEMRLFIVESFDGPNADGVYTLTAKDVLKALEGKTSNAPVLSNGYLLADLAPAVYTTQLLPVGIGSEYPLIGTACIGGKEIVNFSRSGDTLTLLDRGIYGTDEVQHKAQDRFQLCKRYESLSASAIIGDLLRTYANIPTGYIPQAAWDEEVDNFVGTLYSAVIAEPTPVETLVNELILQAALAMWWDETSQTIKMQALRAITLIASFDESNIIAASYSNMDQPDKRMSQVWVYYGLQDVTKRLDDADNYRSTEVTIDEDAESDYGSASIKKIYSRWIPELGRAVAQRLGVLQLARYRDPPRRFNFSVLRGNVDRPSLGGGYELSWWNLQDAAGARESVPIRMTRIRSQADQFVVEAEEALFTPPEEDLDNRIVMVDFNLSQFNLRTAHDTLYPVPESGDVVTCIVEEGAFVGSASVVVPAFDVGSWPAGVDITIIIRGRVQGRGGRGGAGVGDANALAGGVAFYARYPVNLEIGSGEIWAGGGGGGGVSGEGGAGGGGGVGGGGGAGNLPGDGGASSAGLPYGSNGTAMSGGLGSSGPGVAGGTGGGPGLPGTIGFGTGASPPGAGGVAIDGISYVTITVGPGDIRGSEIN